MTTTQLEAVATAIAGVSVTGLTVKDIGGIPESLTLQGPVLFPKPDGFITGFGFTRDTFGHSTALKTITYTLNYLLAYSPVGGTLNEFEAYARMVGLAVDIVTALAALDTLSTAVDWIPIIGEFGIVQDPAGNQRYGCGVAFEITEYLE